MTRDEITYAGKKKAENVERERLERFRLIEKTKKSPGKEEGSVQDTPESKKANGPWGLGAKGCAKGRVATAEWKKDRSGATFRRVGPKLESESKKNRNWQNR